MVLGKLDGYMQKNETRTFSNTILKDKLNMDYRPKSKTVNHKIARGKPRQNTL